MPPGRTRAAAACSSSSWSSGSGCERQRRSGRAARTPSPEQGASTSARSKPVSSAGSARPSAQTTWTFVAPSRADVLLELAGAGGVHLDGDDLAGEHRRLAARRGAEVEHPLARDGADREPGELRAGALRPDAALGECALVDVLDVPGARERPGRARRRSRRARAGRRSPARSFWARISASAPSGAEVAPPRLGDPVGVRVRDGRLLPGRVRQRLDARARPRRRGGGARRS